MCCLYVNIRAEVLGMICGSTNHGYNIRIKPNEITKTMCVTKYSLA